MGWAPVMVPGIDQPLKARVTVRIPTIAQRISCRCSSWLMAAAWVSVISRAAVIMSALVLASVVLFTFCCGWV